MVTRMLPFFSMIRLKHYRERQGLTLRALAKMAKIHYVSLVRLEGEKFDPRLSTLRKLAKALGVSIADLVCESKQGKEVKEDGTRKTR